MTGNQLPSTLMAGKCVADLPSSYEPLHVAASKFARARRRRSGVRTTQVARAAAAKFHGHRRDDVPWQESRLSGSPRTSPGREHGSSPTQHGSKGRLRSAAAVLAGISWPTKRSKKRPTGQGNTYLPAAAGSSDAEIPASCSTVHSYLLMKCLSFALPSLARQTHWQ